MACSLVRPAGSFRFGRRGAAERVAVGATITGIDDGCAAPAARPVERRDMAEDVERDEPTEAEKTKEVEKTEEVEEPKGADETAAEKDAEPAKDAAEKDVEPAKDAEPPVPDAQADAPAPEKRAVPTLGLSGGRAV